MHITGYNMNEAFGGSIPRKNRPKINPTFLKNLATNIRDFGTKMKRTITYDIKMCQTGNKIQNKSVC